LGNENHTKLAIYSCDEDKRLARFIQTDISAYRKKIEESLENEIACCEFDTLLISCEWLHPRIRSTEEFNRLKYLLLQYTDNLEIIMFVRPQSQLYASLYSTGLKGGNYKPFRLPEKIPYFLNYYEIYLNWVNNLDVQKFIVKDFNGAISNGGLVNEFLAEIKVDFLDFELCRKLKISH
jgi:hypothetical protein